MTKLLERRKAIELRRQGKTYTQILSEVKVAKGSISLWLKDITLSEDQINNIKEIRKKAVERYRETMKLKRANRYKSYYEEQKNKLLPFSERELLIAGLFLYWGEGNKVSTNSISINNTNPKVVKFALYWMVKSLDIPKNRIKVQVHLYKDMDIKKELEFWSNELKIPLEQFNNPYIKDSNKSDLDQRGFGHGTCGLSSSNTVIKENILMALEAIPDSFQEKLSEI